MRYFVARLSQEDPPRVRIQKHATRVDPLSHFDEIAKAWVTGNKLVAPQRVCLCPMRSPIVLYQDLLETVEQRLVGDG
jgi:hypothetical protein